MPELIPFHFGNSEVRIQLDENDKPWWVARDVCEVLGLRNVSDAVGRLETGEKGIALVDKLLIINESGLYRLIFRSDKPEAKRFQSWVFEEVLPQIRKTGTYAAPAAPQVKNPAHQLLIDTVVRLDAVEQRAIAAEQRAEQANANALRVLETQAFFTVAEYAYVNHLGHQIPEGAYRACSDHLRVYCLDRGIPFRKTSVGGKRWEEEYSFHTQVYAEALPGWLKRRFAQQHLSVITPKKEP
jgi:prophage antirepressor-like protein